MTRRSGQWIVEEGRRIGAQMIPLTPGEDPAAFLYDEDGLPDTTRVPERGSPVISISDLRERLTEVIAGLATHGKAVRITDDGTPVAVLMDYAAFEALIDDLDDASDYRALADHRGEEVQAASKRFHAPKPTEPESELSNAEILAELRDDY